jgi:dolichyl-phosphate-mannose-protein mannosyltransferase
MHNVIDEQNIVPSNPSYMDGTYFDEIYHARTAYEHLHKIEPYENTHPPLGKLFISLGIAIFGMNPFGWRIVGTLFGVAMIPLMYVFGKRVFGSTRYGFISSLLFTLDFMHFAQTRIATIDVYGVFFIMLMFYYMYRYVTASFYEVQLRKTLVPLMLSGLFFGIGVASKWIVLYGGSGLAILFFWSLLQRYREYRGAKHALHENELAAQELQLQVKPTADPDSNAPVVTDTEMQQSALTEDFFMDENDKAPENQEHPAAEPRPRLKAKEIARYEGIIAAFPRNALLTVLWCALWFILIPLVIYIASYIPFMMVDGPGHGIRNLWDYQVNMYNYHKNLVATHPFASKWYEWPVMVLPIWYYQGHFLPQDKVSSIVSFGNPLVWWPGIVAVFGAVYMAFKTRNKQLAFLLIAFITQYAPWILITRLTFIYHYFAMVPFMVLCLTYFIVHVMDKYPERKRWVYLFLAAVGVVFLMYYPILSGAVVNKYYTMYFLRWLPSWNYF